MAFLFVDLTQKNNRYVQTSVKIIELLLLSAGLFSTLLMLKGALPPYSCHLVFSSLLEFWTSVTCFFLCPLSVCITIHLMVVLILASSAFFSRENSHQDDEISIIVGDHVTQLADLLIAPAPVPAPAPPEPTEQLADLLIAPAPAPAPAPPEPTEHSTAPTKEDEGATMDATWRAITGEGSNQKAESKHLNKNKTWDHVHVPPRVSRLDSEILLPSSPKWKELRKAETFNDAVSATRRGGLVRRDPSMSIEEFNLRVEAFIKNFNNDIRMQRQESDQRFFDTINRGL